jgi:predicted SnoaL-like aldol condensation-catalyzing enzyme
MGVAENKAMARRLIEEVLNKRNVKAIDELLTSNYVEHGLPPGREGFKAFVTAYLAAFPDLRSRSSWRLPKAIWSHIVWDAAGR